MTGTAQTEATELSQIYNLEVVSVPTNRPVVRDDQGDQVYKTSTAKYQAVVDEVEQAHEQGQPVLLGTVPSRTPNVSPHCCRAGAFPTRCSTPNSTPGRLTSSPRPAARER